MSAASDAVGGSSLGVACSSFHDLLVQHYSACVSRQISGLQAVDCSQPEASANVMKLNQVVANCLLPYLVPILKGWPANALKLMNFCLAQLEYFSCLTIRFGRGATGHMFENTVQQIRTFFLMCRCIHFADLSFV